MRRQALVVVIAVVALVMASNAGAGAAELPFGTKATLVSSTDLDDTSVCGETGFFIAREDVHTGTGTHLGRFELVEILCLNLTEFAPPVQPLIPFEVFGTYTAANGDLLWYEVAGIFDASTGQTTSDGFTFTNGTGRFTSAEGSGTTMLERDADGNIVALQQTGVITFDASDRAR